MSPHLGEVDLLMTKARGPNNSDVV
jgi:hypothetical protein